MIIISNKPGQLCNLIIVYANFIAFGKENNIKVKNPAFHQYKNYFEGTCKSSYNLFTYKIFNFIGRLFSKLKVSNRFISAVYINPLAKMDLDEPAVPVFFKSKYCFALGWQYRGNKLLEKYSESIKACFTPLISHQENINHFFSHNLPGADAILVGIHVRRGDYLNFEGGKYFYDYSVYRDTMTKISLLFPAQKIIFLVCSNEPEIESAFRESKFEIVFGPGHELEDLYCLAKCTYLAGPPSTFTMWASFFGNVPLYMIKDKEVNFTLTDFKIQKNF